MKKGIHPETYRLVAFKDNLSINLALASLYDDLMILMISSMLSRAILSPSRI